MSYVAPPFKSPPRPTQFGPPQTWHAPKPPPPPSPIHPIDDYDDPINSFLPKPPPPKLRTAPPSNKAPPPEMFSISDRAEFDINSLREEPSWGPAPPPPSWAPEVRVDVKVAQGLNMDKLVARRSWSCVGRIGLKGAVTTYHKKPIRTRLESLDYTISADTRLFYATRCDGPFRAWSEDFHFDSQNDLNASDSNGALYVFVAIEPHFGPGCVELTQKMWRDQKHTDVTITLEDGAKVHCHRAVLAAASPVFDSMLSHEMSEALTRNVNLEGVAARVAHVFLQCLYTSSLPLDLDLDDVEMMESLICLSDMYQVPALAGKCAEMLCPDLRDNNVVVILKCLGQFCHTSPSMKRAFDSVMKQVQEQPELLLAVCMYPSSLRAGTFSHRQSQQFSCAQESEKVDSETQTSCVKSDAVDVGVEAATCHASARLPEAHQEFIDSEKQCGALASIAEAREQENADLARAILCSKRSVAELPLNSDGVVILRLTRKARSPAVSHILETSELLSHCRKRVADAGCSFSPAWACGAKMLVPLTEEQLQESDKQLSDHHIVALASDMESIRTALKDICSKNRPKLQVSDDCSDHASMEVALHTSDDDGAGDAEDDAVGFVVESEYGPRTDSDVGFPENTHVDLGHASGADMLSTGSR